MNKSIASLLAAVSACVCLNAVAADPATTTPEATTTPAQPGGTLNRAEAKDMRTQSKAEFKARKKVAEANEELDKADCKTAGLDYNVERACKKDAAANTKASKADAKLIHEAEKSDIKANQK